MPRRFVGADLQLDCHKRGPAIRCRIAVSAYVSQLGCAHGVLAAEDCVYGGDATPQMPFLKNSVLCFFFFFVRASVCMFCTCIEPGDGFPWFQRVSRKSPFSLRVGPWIIQLFLFTLSLTLFTFSRRDRMQSKLKKLSEISTFCMLR